MRYVLAIAASSYMGNSLQMTNCVLANINKLTNGVLTLTGNKNGFYNCQTFGVNSISNSSYPFQSAAGDSNYLSTTSIFHNAGTTNVAAALLSELRTATTYAPQDGGLLDTNAGFVDLGYHYSVNEDGDRDGLPDEWEWNYFGTYSLSGTNLDSNGNTLLYDYQNGINPTSFNFSFTVGNRHFNTSTATGNFIPHGIPVLESVLVNDDNFSDAIWTNYDSLIHMNLGATDGVYKVWVGLKGFGTNAPAQWQGTQIILDRVPPKICITNPTNTTLATPVIQLQGWANEELQNIRYDLSNAVTFVTNQSGYFTGEDFDTNWNLATNYFECSDVTLTNGLNVLTIYATDLAGNVTVTNLNLTLDYSSATNPVVNVAWPQDGMKICQSSFTLRGSTEDSSAQVTAQIMDINGNVNTVNGTVERNGKFWLQNIPLADGTNFLTLVVTNSAGLSSVTNLTLVKSDMTLTLDNISGDLWLPTVNVSGHVSDTTAAVWVNGVQGTNYGDGTWSANNVPVSAGGVASFDMKTLPLGQPDPSSNTNVVKDGKTVLNFSNWTYDKTQNVSPRGDGEWEVTHNEGHYQFDKGGTYTGYFELQSPSHETYYTATADYTFGPDGSVISSEFTDSTGYDDMETNGSFPIPTDDGSYSSFTTNFAVTWSESAHAMFKYLGGGQSGNGDQSIYPLGGSATSLVDGTVVPKEQITVASQQLDASGAAYEGKASGVSFDLPQTQPPPLAAIGTGSSENKLLSRTWCTALTDTNNARLDIGVGEQVGLYFQPPIYPSGTNVIVWTVNGQPGSSLLVAPDHAGSVTVSASVNGKAPATRTFNVKEPSGIQATMRSYDCYSSGSVGVGMEMNVVLQPTSVSFGNVLVGESVVSAIVTGYFTNHPPGSHDVAHGAGYHYVSCGNLVNDPAPNNHFDHAWDNVGWPVGVSGTYTWPIKAFWEVNGSTNAQPLSGWTDQVFSLGSDGTMTVTKLGNSATRGTNDTCSH